MSVKPVPEGNHTVTPFLIVDDGLALVDWMEAALGATHVHEPMIRPDGSLGHAQMQIGDSRVMLGAAMEPGKALRSVLYLYVEDCDALYARAVAAGGTSILEPTDQFYGDRHGGVVDPAGNTWWIATHVEDVDEEELRRRMRENLKSEE